MLKRIPSEKGKDGRLSGLREAYFGVLFKSEAHMEAAISLQNGLDHIVRFVESFEVGLHFRLVITI